MTYNELFAIWYVLYICSTPQFRRGLLQLLSSDTGLGLSYWTVSIMLQISVCLSLLCFPGALEGYAVFIF